MKLIIQIPCYNEEESLPEALSHLPREIPGIEDVSSDLQIKNPQIVVAMDRDKISALGLNINQVETALDKRFGVSRAD